MSQSSHVDEIYKSRKTIVSLLKRQGYDVNNYNDFSIHEVHTMVQTKQLDMLFKKEDNSKTAYVKYHLAKSLRPVNIYEYIDDLFNLEEVLKKSDDLIIIMKDEPNDTIQKTLKNIWEQDGIFITIFNIKRLQFNILNHTLVPPHYVLSDEDAKNIKTKFNILSDEQIPDISRFSPVAQAIGLRPGQLCHIVRPSKIAVTSNFYRICIS